MQEMTHAAFVSSPTIKDYTRQHRVARCARRGIPPVCTAGGNNNDDAAMQRMRDRLEGLFGGQRKEEDNASQQFDGAMLRQVVKDRWGVQYDLQPQKRHGRVYVQVRILACPRNEW